MKPKLLIYLLLITLLFFCLPIGSLAWPGPDQLEGSSYLVMDAVSGDMLIEQNIDERRAIASVTKIVTCMTVLTDPAYDPDRLITASLEGTTFASPESVRIGLIDGEQITTRDALIALMVRSANDCANTLAENYSGVDGSFAEKIAAFSAKMNDFARARGANSSNFNNPSGFDVEGHVSTARDVAILAGYAMQNETFRLLVSTPHARLEPTNMHLNADWAIISNSNLLVRYGESVFDSDYFVSYDGIKTGSTPQAGYCLVGSGELADGGRLIGVILNAFLTIDGRQVNIAIPMRTLLEEGARLYREKNPIVETTLAMETNADLIDTATTGQAGLAEETALVSETVVTIPLESDSEKTTDPTLIFVLGGVGLLVTFILIYLLLEMRRKAKRRRRRQALRELREMKDIRDSSSNPPRR